MYLNILKFRQYNIRSKLLLLPLSFAADWTETAGAAALQLDGNTAKCFSSEQCITLCCASQQSLREAEGRPHGLMHW